MSDWCATDKKMWIIKQHVVAYWPRCNYKVEDATHVLECRVDSDIPELEESTIKMKEWLESHNSSPDFSRLIILSMENGKQKSQLSVMKIIVLMG